MRGKWPTKNGRLADNFSLLQALWIVFDMNVKFFVIAEGSWCCVSIKDYVQPQFVIVGDLHDIDILYIVTQLSANIGKNLWSSHLVTWLILYFQCFLWSVKEILTFFRASIAWNWAQVDSCHCSLPFQWLGKFLRLYLLKVCFDNI